MPRSPGILPSDYASALRGSLNVRPCTCSELARILRASLRPFLRALAATKGPRFGGILPQKRSARHLVFALDPGPPSTRRASQALREKPAGSRRGIAAMAKQCMDALSEQPRKAEKRREPRAQREARCRGCISLGYFSLCKQREVTRSLQASGSFALSGERKPCCNQTLQASGSFALSGRRKLSLRAGATQ